MCGSEQNPIAQNPSISPITMLNDLLRQHCVGGHIVITSGVKAIAAFDPATLLSAIAAFEKFTPDNDPYGEHDFGNFEYAGEKLFWKIDYFDNDLHFASPDPADPLVTERILTIMLTSEY